jgi:hypothetical protein
MNKTLLSAILFLSLSASFQAAAQSTTLAPAKGTEMTKERPTTALKPTDATPYQFASQEELDNAVPRKTEAIKARMSQGGLTDEQHTAYRIELWRLENAVVVKQ